MRESQPSNAAVRGTENPLTVKAPPRPRRGEAPPQDNPARFLDPQPKALPGPPPKAYPVVIPANG